MCGHILDCFDRYFDLSHSREAMLRFAHTQLDSSRKSVAKKLRVSCKSMSYKRGDLFLRHAGTMLSGVKLG